MKKDKSKRVIWIGSLIGFLVGIFFSLLFFVLVRLKYDVTLKLFFDIFYVPLIFLSKNLFQCFVVECTFMFAFIIPPIFYGLIGGLIGYIIYAVKKLKNEIKK